MKNILSLSLIILLSFNAFSQEVIDTASTKKIKLNRWSLDLSFGSSRGIRPYNDGYFSTENDKFLGEINLNSVNIGARYYVNKYVTFKSDLATNLRRCDPKLNPDLCRCHFRRYFTLYCQFLPFSPF